MNARSVVPVVFALLVAPLPTPAQEHPFTLKGLVVTASPTPRPADAVGRSVTVLEGEELRVRGLWRVLDALREVPGLSVVQGGSFGGATSVFLRGGESDYVQVLVDGVQVNQPGGSFDFSGLTLENVERIEVVRGPASSLFGSDAVAGVIHVITGSGRGEVSGSLAMRAGSYGRRDLTASVSGGSATSGWSFSLGSFRTDGVLPFNNAHRNTVLSGAVRLAPDAATGVAVAVRLADRVYRFPTDATGAATDRNSFTFADEASVSASVSRWLGDVFQVRGHVGVHRTDGGTDDQADGPADTLGAFGFTSLDHVQRATADVRIAAHMGTHVGTLGGEVEEQTLRSFSESLSQWGSSAGRSSHDRWNRAAYAHVNGERGTLSYGVGGRLEQNERFGRFVTWNVEATWRAAAGTRVRASAGRSVKEPTFFENFADGFVTGNPALDPERARSWDAGIEQSWLRGRLTLRATYFHQAFRDLIEYTSAPPEAGDPNYFNVGGANARGAEMGAEVRLGSVRAGGDWTWLDTEVVQPDPSDGSGSAFSGGARLLRRPTHTGRAFVGVQGAWGGLRLDAQRVGSRDDRDFSTFPAERVVLPSYTVLGLGIDLPLRKTADGGTDLALSLRGDNLLDSRYEEVLGFRAPGRGLYLGVRVALGGP